MGLWDCTRIYNCDNIVHFSFYLDSGGRLRVKCKCKHDKMHIKWLFLAMIKVLIIAGKEYFSDKYSLKATKKPFYCLNYYRSVVYAQKECYTSNSLTDEL